MRTEVLIVEDDYSIQKGIVDFMQENGIKCTMVNCVKEARNLIERYLYQVILLDLGLPDGDGLDLITEIKTLWPQTGIIVISARDKLEDRVDGLNLGADDYLVKPFHLAELSARIHAVLRRKSPSINSVKNFEEIQIDTISNSVTIAGKEIELSKKEYHLLLFFIENQNRVLTKENLFEHVWGENSVFMNNADFIYTTINRVRKKLKMHCGNNYIKTIHGFGYKLES